MTQRRRCERGPHGHWHGPHGHGPHGHGRHGHGWRHKKKLQRRLFMWIGATIVFTAMVVGMVFRVLSPTERLQRDAEGFTRFVSGRLEEVWDDPEARDHFVRDLHDDLRLDASLYDATGALLVRHGRACDEPWGQFALTRADGEPLGRLVACGEPYQWGGWRFGLVLAVALFILWLASGILARRLLRPLSRLEVMAKKLGEGDLTVRAGLDPHRDGELGVLGTTMDEMATRIEKQLADQRELLAAVSHELRTPLGHLRVLIEMAREKPSPKIVEEIDKEVLEVDGLVGQLLATSRLDFGTLTTKTVDVVELSARALERVDVAVDKLSIEGDAGLVEADPTLLARAIANLLRNAEIHGGGATALSVRFLEREVVFAVEDHGPGFGNGDRQRVFEAFYRGEHRAGASLGLGLSLVHRIAEAHGGRAWIEDVEGGGARVLFSISAVSA